MGELPLLVVHQHGLLQVNRAVHVVAVQVREDHRVHRPEIQPRVSECMRELVPGRDLEARERHVVHRGGLARVDQDAPAAVLDHPRVDWQRVRPLVRHEQCGLPAQAGLRKKERLLALHGAGRQSLNLHPATLWVVEGKPPISRRGARTARLGRVAARGALNWAGDRLDSRGTADEQRRRRGDRIVATVDGLVDQLAVMRGAAMKAGQVLSTVEFPGLDEDQSEYLQSRLASLRDNVPPVSWKDMRKVLASDWGEKPEQVLAHIDEEPAAAASIGQVYRGQTADRRDVAIKIQYPGVAESVEADMRNLLLLSPLLRQLMPGLEVKDLLAELRERIVEECDYELEASNHRRVERFWRGHPFVLVPAVDTELSTRRVLVTDWVDGIGFAAVGEQPDEVRDRYAQIVYRFFYGTALHLGLALGGPHPGNYLLCHDGRVA